VRRALLVVTLLLPASDLAAQQIACRDTETLQDCWNRIDDFLLGAAGTREQTDSVEEVLAGRTTGISALGSGLASSVSDFLPTIAGALGLTQTTTEDGATALETNLLVPLGANPQRIRLQGLLRKPGLYQPVADTLPSANRDARRTALEQKLRDFDDVRVAVAWNLENRTFGRSFDEARLLADHLLSAQIAQLNATPALQARRMAALAAFQAAVKVSDDDVDASRPGCARPGFGAFQKVAFGCYTSARQTTANAALITAVRELRAIEDSLRAMLWQSGFFQLGVLIDNQPQLNLEVATDLRRNLVGPNQFNATLRYEAGFTNLNGLRRACRAAAADTLIAPACLRHYLDNPRNAAAMQRGDRFSVSVAFARRGDYHLVLPADSVDLRLDGTWDLSGSLGLGRFVAFDRHDQAVGRIDLLAEYVYHHDDPDRSNRFVATATYTQRLSGSLSVAAGVSYASRPEFLGEVDKKVSANFGLRYKFINN